MPNLTKYARAATKNLWHIVDKLNWSLCGIKLTGTPTEHEPDPGRHCVKCWQIQEKKTNVKSSQLS